MLFGMLLISDCSNSKNNHPNKNKTKMIEIVVYIDALIQMEYVDNSFISNNKEYTSQINSVTSNQEISVKQLTGKTPVSESDSIFILSTQSQDTSQLLKDLQSLSFVNGAYIKPQAEEPSLDFE